MPAINKIILGTVQFGLNYGINNSTGIPNTETVNKILLTAQQAGIHTLDTAEAYGTAHKAIGMFHANSPHKKFNTITKLPNRLDMEIGLKIDMYLKELKVDKLNALFFHSYSGYQENKTVLKKLLEFKQSGKIENVGVSVYTNEEALDILTDPVIDLVQLPFNLLDNHYLRGDLFKRLKDKGKKVHVRSVFLQGLFYMHPLQLPSKLIALKPFIEYLNELTLQSELDITALALQYALSKDYIDGVLIGVDDNMQLEKNIDAARKNVDEKVFKIIDEIKVQQTELLNPSKW